LITFSNGTSWWASASSTVSLVRVSSCSQVGSPARSARSGSMLTNMPTTPSSSGADRPATGEPTAKSVCLV
jgi:hypothetical protein